MRKLADVVVCVHNSLEDVRVCLESLASTVGPDDGIIIVDDGSDYPTERFCLDFVQRMGRGRCKLIRHEKARGFCGAANAGAKLASRDICIFLNSDTVVNGDWIDRLANAINQRADIGLAGPLSNAGGWQTIPLLPRKGKSPVYIPGKAKRITNIDNYCRRIEVGGPVLVEQLNGFCLAVKQEVFSKIGYFDEVAFPRGYGEESDFLIRAKNAGFAAVVATNCFVYHSKTKSYTTADRLRLVAAGQIELKRKHGAETMRSSVAQTRDHPTLQKIRRRTMVDFLLRGWLF